MKVSLRFASLAVLLATAACSGGGSTNDAGADAAKEGGTIKDSGVKDTGSTADADDGGQPEPMVDPVCALADAGVGTGSCVVRDDAGTDCNPVTNDGCDFVDAGEACDTSQTGFSCYNQPPNTAALCATCDVNNGPACLPGHTCVSTDAGAKCARYCCSDSDCAPGHCDLTTLSQVISPAGVCVK
jgi:hypothetical protein